MVHREHILNNGKHIVDPTIPKRLQHHVHHEWLKKKKTTTHTNTTRRNTKNINPFARAQILAFTQTIKQATNTYINTKYHYHHSTTQHTQNIAKLNELQNNGTIIIKQSDKTHKLVIMDRNTYHQYATTHLNDTRHYTQQLTTTTPEATTQRTIQNFSGVRRSIYASNLPLETKHSLKRYTQPDATTTRIPRIYFNPKDHKSDGSMRPIVSGIGWCTEKCAILIDEALKNIIYKHHKHIPKDTFQFLQLLERQQPQLLQHDNTNIHLVTFDVEALYTSIPQQAATQRAYKLILKHNNIQANHTDTHQIPAAIYREMCRYTLENNFFSYGDTIYKQHHGIAMGCPAGGSLANTYLLEWEATFMNNTLYQPHILFYTRYYDDGFMIWSGHEQQLTQLLNHMNQIDPHIHITHSRGQQATYLDVDMMLSPHNIIYTRTHRKPTATSTYLNFHSSHPAHLKRNLPYSIFLRSFLIANTQATYTMEKKNIGERFHNSGYTQECIHQQLEKLERHYKIPQHQDQYLYHRARLAALNTIGNNKQAHKNDNLFLPITYWPGIPTKQIINKQAWQDKLHHTKIKQTQPTISFKQPPSLLRMLTRSKLPSTKTLPNNTETHIPHIQHN